MAIKLKITINDKPVEKIILKAKRTLDGNIIISDHPDINILVMPGQSKIVAMPREELDDEVYESQKRFFNFLVSKGVITYDSVHGGNLFMSKEGTIPKMSGDGDNIQHCLYVISNFIDQELPFYKNMKEFEKQEEDRLLEPEVDEYTEFDVDKHADSKGSLPPKMVKYGISSIYRL